MAAAAAAQGVDVGAALAVAAGVSLGAIAAAVATLLDNRRNQARYKKGRQGDHPALGEELEAIYLGDQGAVGEVWRT